MAASACGCWEQWLPHAAQDIWPFFCDANNLEDITPPFLSFRVLGQSTPAIGTGTLIDYRLKLNGIPIRWQTRIDTWDPPRRFIDLQAKGPYCAVAPHARLRPDGRPAR